MIVLIFTNKSSYIVEQKVVSTMEHLLIFFNVIILIVGALAAFYIYQAYKTYRFPFLQPFMHCIIFYNLLLLTNLAFQYLQINLLAHFLSYKTSVYHDIFDPFITLFFIGLAYSLFRVVLGFKEKSISPRFNRRFAVGMIILMLTYALRLILFYRGTSPIWLFIIHVSVFLIAVFMPFVLFIHILIHCKKIADPNKRRIINTFGFLYLTGCILLILFMLFSRFLNVFSIPTVFLIFNLFPFFWIKRILLRYGNALPFVMNKYDLEKIYHKYTISKREQEIIDLVLHGKSNSEIANSLFIAKSTVKNHIYRLYQKLGVKSRFELVNFFLESGKWH